MSHFCLILELPYLFKARIYATPGKRYVMEEQPTAPENSNTTAMSLMKMASKRIVSWRIRAVQKKTLSDSFL